MAYKNIFCLIALFFQVITCNAQENLKVKNVILMIGDGMGLAQTYAAYSVQKGRLNMYSMPVTGVMITYSSDNYVTDSGAGGTAIACGRKTKNGRIGLDDNDRPIKSILELASENKKSTGIVVTSSIVHATPASFYAHVRSRNDYDSIATFFLNKKVDVAIGGGKKFFINDKQNMIDKLSRVGYKMCFSLDSVDNNDDKVICLLADDEMPKKTNNRGEMLSIATQKALNILSKNKNGFFLMVEGSQIDWGGHNNDIDFVVSETIDFDNAIGVVMNFLKNNPNTLVVIAADHETGGLALPAGNISNGEIKTVFSTTNHTGMPVIVYADGACAEFFTGVYQNTDIYWKIKKLFITNK